MSSDCVKSMGARVRRVVLNWKQFQVVVFAVAAIYFSTAAGGVAAAVTSTPAVSDFDTAAQVPGQVVTSPVGALGSGQGFANPGVLTFGNARSFGSPTNLHLQSPAVAMAPTSDSQGYWIVAADGGVFSYGDASFYGSAGNVDLYAPIVATSSMPDNGGYWLGAMDGGIFAYGNARFYGSMGGKPLNEPIVGMTATPDGKGYWLVASDGGIFAFGDAAFYGSMGGQTLNSPIVGMTATKDGKGYWLVAADGGVFAFGDAVFYGSMGGTDLASSVVAMAATPDSGGYWLAGSNGGIYALGDAAFYGSNALVVPTPPISAMSATKDGGGYWLLDPDAFPTEFTHPSPLSPVGNASQMVSTAAGQIVGDPDQKGNYCNPYGPCEAWCALFATWVWDSAGVGIPRYAFVGDLYNWAAKNGTVLLGSQVPARGELVLYGTGPSSVNTAVHTGIVADVWPNGAIVTIEGDAGPGPDGHHDVILNGPFLPSQSKSYNGFGIFAYVLP